MDLTDRVLGAVQIAARVPHLRQVEPGAVAHPGGNVRRQQLLEARTGLVVQPERQIQAAQEQLRLRLVVRQEVPMLIRIQARDRLEIVVRVDVEENVAVVQIADARRRKLLGSGRAASTD